MHVKTIQVTVEAFRSALYSISWLAVNDQHWASGRNSIIYRRVEKLFSFSKKHIDIANIRFHFLLLPLIKMTKPELTFNSLLVFQKSAGLIWVDGRALPQLLEPKENPHALQLLHSTNILHITVATGYF